MLRASVLVLALLLNAPTIWAAFGTQTTSVTTALIHYLITVPVLALLLELLRLATGVSGRNPARSRVGDDGPAPVTAPDTRTGPDAT